MSKKESSKIFILTNTLKTGGAEKQSVFLANALQKEFQTTLVVYYGNQCDNKLFKIAEAYNINVERLSGSHLNKCIRLLKMFRLGKPAVVFSYLATTNLINAIIGTLGKASLKIGGIRSSQISPFKLFVQRFLHNHFLTASVFNNYAGLNLLSTKGFKPEKAIVIPNCINIKAQPIQRPEKELVQILSMGRFVESKDYQTALLSIKELTKNQSLAKGYRYLIIGYGKLENEIRNLIQEYELTTLVSIVINPDNTEQFLRESDIFLSTSVYEGLSNAIMEAMEYSLPVIATDVGDNDKLVLDNKTGFLVTAKDTHSISDRISELINSSEMRNKMGEQAYRHLMKNYSEEAFKSQYLNLIENLSDEK
ncbi:MAG: glycosyltransferase [Bacteroidales bacterium]|nr:glycosyltransferase [Bacteroidales bacterium]